MSRVRAAIAATSSPTRTTRSIGCVRNGFQADNAAFVKNNINTNKTYGGRAALKIDLDENWTVTPTIMHQNSETRGVWYFDERLGDLETQRFRKEPGKDKFTQYALTVEGKVGNFDITYAGAYMHRPNSAASSDYTDYTDAYDAYYESYGGLANYQYYFDNNGDPIDPRQYITGGNNFKKLSQELRVSPARQTSRSGSSAAPSTNGSRTTSCRNIASTIWPTICRSMGARA